ncbi:gamma carbonic anhydrase family protein [Iodobacter fluviatilis]|uniref:Carbonic anhydrase/acetyltransferase-like protein (Isoleucine patch superfamily) n=1 Tax=Iodobacter fluviatilis TaxID=537 RepID=A0A377SVJ7_9NEIS|nr:gamma carbonic anhydrase family protein [Iodobacter fluviatilis]TCU81373.1 carbonic anhydrase/acetyltransferase-like protein (isoleucine patch superfamily) [Iodobacter fluviatilis]STR46041.1 carnitine operon protein CaiE [Iodobacter fluviatilis]
MAIGVFDGIKPEVKAGAWVHDSAQVIGEVLLGENASVWPGAVIRGDVNAISIGKDSNVQDCAVLHVTHKRPDDPAGAPLVIGERVTIGHGVMLHGCTIGNECLIGMGTIVLDRVVIEDRVMIGAGSLVPPNRRLESGWLYMGRPAEKKRLLNEAELANFNYSAAHYVRLMAKYRDAE